MDAEQPAFAGLAPRKRRRRAPVEHTPARHDPIARVVLDVQATHLGQTFDYLVDEQQADAAVPGAFVAVRFGGQRVSGVIWERAASSTTAASALRYLERVITTQVTVPASLRDDITAIADAYGGTRANILRLAVPPRVAKVEAEQRLAASFTRGRGTGRFAAAAQELDRRGAAMLAAYGEGTSGLTAIRDALGRTGFAAYCVDPLPGVGEKSRLLAWMAVSALAAGRPAVIVLPGVKETEDLLAAIVALGVEPFAPSPSGGWAGDVAVLNAALPRADRYRTWMAIAAGQVRCVIGSRAAMYAPVADGGGLFAMMDDIAYQQADGMMPYAQARGVMRLRARLHGGVFVSLADARSPVSQWEVAGADDETGAGHVRRVPEIGVSGPATAVHPLPAVTRTRSPWIRWLNREELIRLSDPSVGSRVPHVAVANIRRALDAGPVLFSIPSDGVDQTLGCTSCLRQARCPRCTGPLTLPPGSTIPRCRWCNASASPWTCPHCHGSRLRVIHVGAAGTAQELQGLFRGVPMLLSSLSQPHGVVQQIEARPMIVIATPGAEPRVVNPDGTIGAYAAVAVLDAWTSLYKPGVDARVDTLNDWMRAVGMCAPRGQGGQALLIGETDPVLARSLMLWDSSLLAAREVAERLETGLPPVVTAACVWGRRDAVEATLRRIGVTDGEYALCPLPGGGSVPGMLGPVPISADRQELDGTDDRVKAVVRVPPDKRSDLAVRLRTAVARHVANREAGELRFQIDPKDLI